VLSFGFGGTPEQLDHFLEGLELFGYQANLGDARSLVIDPPRVTHGELTPGEQAKAGIAPETVRLSIGLEDPQDLIGDLDAAFAKARS